MPSQKKLNTYGVESPCEYSPGVGSFLANLGLSKEQLVPSCVMRAFVMWGDYYFLYSLGLTPDFILKKFVKADWSLNPKSNASSPIGLSVIRSCLQASP